MKQIVPLFLTLLTLSSFSVGICAAESGAPARRPAWTTSQIKGSPEPPSPFISAPAFPKLKFVEPLEMVPIPGGNRWVLAEHAGKIVSFVKDRQTDHTEIFADMKKWRPDITEVYSVEFDPGFSTNRFVYIWYILKPEQPDGTVISRFKLPPGDPPQVDLASEEIIIRWKAGGHNGGCMRFGLDDYMYIATGDGAGPDPPDGLNTGQDVSDLLSSILRIDVRGREKGLNYRIPADNPFVKLQGARPEVYAYGLRNPWRMSIDRATGDLWLGDVGWELWEMVQRVQKGGNYGWSIVEGSKQPVKPDGLRGPTPILLPTFELPHSEAASITGGYVYHGKKFPALQGGYIYGDFDTGKIWELRFDGKKVTSNRELVDTPFKIVSFGEDLDGELYFIDFGGQIHQLEKNPAAGSPSRFPTRLKDTGLFSSLKTLAPAKGVVDYTINSGLWSDGANARRWIGIPGTNEITANNDGNWQFPQDTVLVRHLEMEMEKGVPASNKRIETQVMHLSADGWKAYSYRWDADGKDASLVASAGGHEELKVKDSSAPDGFRAVDWRFHSRTECLRCHNSWCGGLLGFLPSQLNRPAGKDKGPGETNQIQRLAQLGVFHSRIGGKSDQPAMADPTDPSQDLTLRARAYLHSNCSHCHREHAGGSVLMFLNYEMPVTKAGFLNTRPAQGDLGILNAHIITPGYPEHSVLFYRMAKSGKGHMPYLGSTSVDPAGLALIADWISQMPEMPHTNATEQLAFNNLRMKEMNATARLRGRGISPEGLDASLSDLLSNPGSALSLVMTLDTGMPNEAMRAAVLQRAASVSNPLVRDLFERFLPEAQRTKTLGLEIDPAKLLAIRGDAARGFRVFAEEGRAQCQACHKVGGMGQDFGPELSGIGTKYDRAGLLEQILHPSTTIEPAYIAYSVELKDGTSYTGFVLRRDAAGVEIKIAANSVKQIPAAQIQSIIPQKLSLMPEGLFQGMTAQDAADLIEYLSMQRLAPVTKP